MYVHAYNRASIGYNRGTILVVFRNRGSIHPIIICLDAVIVSEKSLTFLPHRTENPTVRHSFDFFSASSKQELCRELMSNKNWRSKGSNEKTNKLVEVTRYPSDEIIVELVISNNIIWSDVISITSLFVNEVILLFNDNAILILEMKSIKISHVIGPRIIWITVLYN